MPRWQWAAGAYCMSPRSYHPDRGSTGTERKRRFDAKRRAEAFSLARIGDAPPTRREKLAAAALQQPRPAQFTDTWGQGGRFTEQYLREDVDIGRQYDGYGPDLAFDTWVPTKRRRTYVTTKEILFKDGKYRRVPVAPADPMLVIIITPELERQALETLARLARRGRRKRWW